MMALLRKNRKGFTLIELMIVVAIIGILAAVAVPAFIKYIKDSKTAESKENLAAISNGALAYYQAEHDEDGSGMKVFTRSYPAKGDNSQVPTTVPTMGTKVSPAETAIAAALIGTPWTDLKFSIGKPFYYQYNYDTTGGTGTDGKVDIKGFVAYATAQLGSDVAEGDSCFAIAGYSTSTEPVVGAIVDIFGSKGACSAPTPLAAIP